MDAAPTTAYLMTHKSGKCMANCGFCPQARASKSSTEMLSRVSWPTYPTTDALSALARAANNGRIKRVCIQALNYPTVFDDLEAIVHDIKRQGSVQVSVSCQPLNRSNIERLKDAGVDRLGIALDAATEAVFDRVKGKDVGSSYTWDSQFHQLEEALSIFGKDSVSTHVIVGLGESEEEAATVLQRCVCLGVLPALFAFTPVRGTALEGSLPPLVEVYRRMQLARYLVVNGKARQEDMQFDDEGRITGFGLPKESIEPIIDSGLPFQTSGCPDCNRPYYNEKPSGPIYNYPKKPTKQEIEKIKRELRL